ncbi:MAG: AsmA-like C-terminal domain-containing protein [Desulfuromusa sp.]
MKQPSARILIRIIYSLLIVFATFFTLLIVFLSQLDLNDYRLSLEKQLTLALKQPVQIGHSSLTFNHGLALALKDLQIGSDRAPLAVVPQITATLKIAPLFQRQFILDQVQIDNPSIQIWLPFPDRPTKGTSHNLFNTLGISILSVHNANIKIFQKQKDDAVQRLVLTNLHAVLRGWKPEKTGQLVVSGQLQKQSGHFLLETRLPSSRDPDVWRNEEHQTQLKITNFSLRKLLKRQDQILPESLDLDLKIHGVPATGADFDTTLSSSNNSEQFFSLSGRWTSANEQDSITKLKGELLKIPFSGEFYFIRQLEKYFLGGKFGAENVTLNPQILKTWRIPNADKLLYGELDRLAITLEKSWNPANKISGLPRIGAEITVCNLDWDIPELKQFQDLSVDLSLQDKTLSIKDGILIGGNQLINFSGKVHSLFLQPQMDLNFNFNPDLNDFVPLLNLPENWSLSGNIPGSLHLTGSLLKPDFLLQADLSSVSLQVGTLFHKQPTDQSKLQLQGSLDGQRFQFDRAAFTLNDLNISGAGYFQQIQGEQEFSFTAGSINLSLLKPFSPLLKKLHIEGEVEPTLTQHKDLQGVLKLKDVGAQLTSIIGKLNKTNGEIDLDRYGFTFQKLKTSLGESNFIVDGIFSDWKNPQFDLDLSSNKIRAHDLIFSNRQLTLYDLDGHLKINRDGISFSPVKVRLEDNTLATVNGKISNFSNPEVSLDIQSDQVDVLDIIHLFVGPKATKFKKNSHGGPPLQIKVSVKQGTLGGLNFQNAEGLITGDKDRLTIFPLNFDNGKGWCQTRIEFDYSQKEAPLKISGHMEGINASVLHQDIFEKPGLINGNLKGDFYLEGNPEKDLFWQKARGGMHIQISNGTLKKFHGLAQVFSLLNVSQIFAGKLPDMNKEGMPFTLMEGSIQIGDGQIKTEDMKVTSEAMNLSMVGTQGLIDDALDFNLGVMPLRTVDKIITSIPIAGWVLAGKDKALITAHFKVKGTSENPKVTAVPIDSVSNTVFGIFKRTLGLPGKLVKDIGSLFKKEPEKKVEAE